MKSYSWQDTFEVERKGNDILDAMYGSGGYIIVHGTRAHQRQEVDRVHINKGDARDIRRVEYKVDDVAGRTGNLALEHVSVRRGEKIVKRGWVHTTEADLLVCYVPAVDIAYEMKIEAIRERWRDIQFVFDLRHTSSHGLKGDYCTDFYAVPLKWLKGNGLISKERSAIGAQLRFDLKVPRG